MRGAASRALIWSADALDGGVASSDGAARLAAGSSDDMR
jgi:hypothetical protein